MHIAILYFFLIHVAYSSPLSIDENLGDLLDSILVYVAVHCTMPYLYHLTQEYCKVLVPLQEWQHAERVDLRLPSTQLFVCLVMIEHDREELEWKG